MIRECPYFDLATGEPIDDRATLSIERIDRLDERRVVLPLVRSQLTRSERRILDMLLEGLTVLEIAPLMRMSKARAKRSIGNLRSRVNRLWNAKIMELCRPRTPILHVIRTKMLLPSEREALDRHAQALLDGPILDAISAEETIWNKSAVSRRLSRIERSDRTKLRAIGRIREDEDRKMWERVEAQRRARELELLRIRGEERSKMAAEREKRTWDCLYVIEDKAKMYAQRRHYHGFMGEVDRFTNELRRRRILP